MILYDTSIEIETNYIYKSQAALALSQLLMHSCSHQRTEQTITRHSRNREPPRTSTRTCIYMHSKTRSRDMVETFYKMGLSVTYDPVLCMSADLANSAINYFELKGVVCSQSLKRAIFTTSAVDNIDHDVRSTITKTSSHWTGISMFQHADNENMGIEQERYLLSKSKQPNFQTTKLSYTSTSCGGKQESTRSQINRPHLVTAIMSLHTMEISLKRWLCPMWGMSTQLLNSAPRIETVHYLHFFD